MSTGKRILHILIVAIAGVSCRPTVSLHTETPELPNRYGAQTDSITGARTHWKKIITDTTLVSLIDIALENNLDGRIALQRIGMAGTGLRSAKGAILPTVSVAAEAAQRKWGQYTMDGAGNASTYIRGDEIVPEHLPDFFLGFRAAWEVDIWGKLKSKKAGALARYLASIEGRNFVTTNIIAEVALTYFELVRLDNELKIIRNTTKLQESALQMISVQKSAGVANELAVSQMEAQLLHTQKLERQVQQEIFATESELNMLLGRVATPVQRNSSLYEIPVEYPVAAGVPSDLLLNRPDIRKAEYELRAAKADVRAARAAFLPTLNVSAAYGFQAYKTSLLFLNPESIAYGFVGTLMAPVLNRSAIKANFEYANAVQQEALYAYQRAILAGYTEVSVQLAQFDALSDQAELKRREVEALDRSIEVSNELFRSGRANYIEVIMAQNNSFNAKKEFVELKQLQHVTAINLYRALGGGSGIVSE